MRNNLIIVYLVIFISVLILLRFIGVISINNDELIGYGLITYGLSLFYSAFIESRKLFVFIGSTVFLIGVFFFITGNFEFENTDKIFVPAAIFILSVNSLMVFLSDTSFKLGLYAAIILFAAGLGALAITSTHGIENFINYTVNIFKIYWPVLIILFAVVALVNVDLKDKKKDSA
ncbi:MAG: hypothetical protein E2O46_00850 [Ignavibacteria bacterium]|nr:MAG: hypothetical protein E2O46_00850 [Ignavibacteria bacterium]